MTTKPTIDKILAEALELHEKGVSLHSIVRTYPEYREAIEQLFAAMSTLSLEKEKIRVPKEGLERILASLPEIEPAVAGKTPIASPFSTFMAGIQLSSLKFVLPILALALLTGGLVLHNDASTPSGIAPMTPENVSAPAGGQSSTGTPSSSAGSAVSSPAAKPSPKTATPAPGAPTAAPMTMMAAPANQSQTDRMVASFSQEAAQESTIAEQDNDAQSEQAISADKAMTTDPTASSPSNTSNDD